ncbi:MAG: hypothetical protein QX198_10650 [Methylococcaceae bacterium]
MKPLAAIVGAAGVDISASSALTIVVAKTKLKNKKTGKLLKIIIAL